MNKKETELMNLKCMMKRQTDQKFSLEQVQKANESLQSTLEEKESQIVMLEKQSIHAEQTNQRLTSELGQTKRQLRVFTNKRKHLEQELESFSQQLKEERSHSTQVKEELSQYQRTIEERDKEINLLKNLLDKEKRCNGNLENLRDEQENNMALLKQSLSRESARVAGAESKTKKYRQEASDATRKLEELKIEAKEKEKQLRDRLASTERKMEKAINQVNNQLEQEEKRDLQLEMEEEHKREVQNLKNLLEEQRSEGDVKDQALSEMTEQYTQMVQLLNEREIEISEVNADYEKTMLSMVEKDQIILNVQEELAMQKEKSTRQFLDGEESAEVRNREMKQQRESL